MNASGLILMALGSAIVAAGIWMRRDTATDPDWRGFGLFMLAALTFMGTWGFVLGGMVLLGLYP